MQLSDRENKTLNELLQVNLVSKNVYNEKSSKKKPKSFKFLYMDNIGTYRKDQNCRNRPQLTSTSFYQNFKKNNKTNRKLSYKPKRLVKLYGGEIPLKMVGKATLDCTKTFYKEDGDNFEKKMSNFGKKNKIYFPSDNEIIDSNNQAEFKATSGVKFAHCSNNFYKLKRNIDIISEGRKRNYDDLFNKIMKLLDTQSQQFFIDDIHENNYLNQTPTMSSTVNTLCTPRSNTLNYKSISIEKNTNFKIRKIISLCLDINSTFYKFLNVILTELREKHDENMKLMKKSNEQEIRVIQISKELENLQKYHNRYDVNAKIYLRQGRENSIKHIKEVFNRKENEYIINIYKLEDEIRNLTVLLNKNKEYYNKLKETEKEVEKSKKQNEEMKFIFNKEIHEKIIQNANEKDKEEELNNKLHDLEDTIDKLKEEQEINKRKEIETTAKVKKIRMIVNEKTENILMLNEELEWFIREYHKEKFNHNNTKAALQILENRLFKDDDRIDGEKSRKEESGKKDKNDVNNIKESNNITQKDENKETTKLSLNVSSDSN